MDSKFVRTKIPYLEDATALAVYYKLSFEKVEQEMTRGRHQENPAFMPQGEGSGTPLLGWHPQPHLPH